MNDWELIKRHVKWTYKEKAGGVWGTAIEIFLLFYIFIGRNCEPDEVFDVYLSGFLRADFFALVWLWLHLPIEGLLFGILNDAVNKSYNIKLIKYGTKTKYFTIEIVSILPLLVTYYCVGYFLIMIFLPMNSLHQMMWLGILSFVESINIVLAAFLLGMVFKRYENISFLIMIIIEILNCCICGERRSILLRLLPFTQSKPVLQGGFFDNGIALVIALLYCGVTVFTLTMLWIIKKGES